MKTLAIAGGILVMLLVGCGQPSYQGLSKGDLVSMDIRRGPPYVLYTTPDGNVGEYRVAVIEGDNLILVNTSKPVELVLPKANTDVIEVPEGEMP